MEPRQWPRLPARPDAVHVALAAAAEDGTKRRPRPGQPRPLRRVRGDPLGRTMGRGAPAGMPHSMGLTAGRRLRRRDATHAHLPQLAWFDARGPGALESR